MKTNQPIDFSIPALNEETPLNLGEKGQYVIRGASGLDASTYECDILEASHTIVNGNPIGMRHRRQAERALCLKCIFEVSTNQPIGEGIYDSLQVPQKQRILEEVIAISNLRDKTDKEKLIQAIDELKRELNQVEEQEEREKNFSATTEAGLS